MGNALDNDTVNGDPCPSRHYAYGGDSCDAVNGGPGPVVDPLTGVVSVPAGTPAATYDDRVSSLRESESDELRYGDDYGCGEAAPIVR